MLICNVPVNTATTSVTKAAVNNNNKNYTFTWVKQLKWRKNGKNNKKKKKEGKYALEMNLNIDRARGWCNAHTKNAKDLQKCASERDQVPTVLHCCLLAPSDWPAAVPGWPNAASTQQQQQLTLILLHRRAQIGFCSVLRQNHSSELAIGALVAVADAVSTHTYTHTANPHSRQQQAMNERKKKLPAPTAVWFHAQTGNTF